MRRPVLLLCLLVGALQAEDVVPRIERWELHTSLLSVRAVASDGVRLWAATEGGLFSYEPTTGVIVPMRKTEGLLTHDLTALAADSLRGLLLAGAADGTVELYRDRWEHVTDIRNEPGIPDKRIYAIAVRGRYAYLGTAFGLVVLDLATQTIAQVVRRMGTFSDGAAVYAICFWRDSIWVATAAGLAAAPVEAPALNYPPVWRVVVQTPVRFLLVADTVLFVGGDKQLWSYAAGVVTVLRDYAQPLVGIAAIGKHLWVATQDELWQERPQRRQLSLPTQRPTGLWAVTVGTLPLLLLAAEEEGLWWWHEGQWRNIRPNTPHTNLLLSCVVDAQGNLWCATDRVSGRGFACLHDGVWYGFTVASLPLLGKNEYHQALLDPSGTAVWLASWGGGLLRASRGDTGFTFERYDVANTPLRGIPADTTFLPIGGIAFDAQGNLWGVCHWCVTGALFRRTASGNIEPLLTALSGSQRQNLAFAIDPFGTKWFGSLVGEGLFYFREQEGQRAESWGRLTASTTALPNNTLYALAVDHEGMLWVGTPAGVGVVLNPSAVLGGSMPVVRNVNLLRDQAVYAIAVDVHNNKWLATDTGVWVVNPDATAVLLRLTADTSPLPSNQVRALTIDQRSGRVMVGTTAGLAILWTSARLPQAQYSLQCYPQPFSPEQDGLLTIDGLAEQSIVRVLTLEGVRVAGFQTQSRTAYWDGRNEQGELVPAGVYIITAVSAATGQTAQAKVVVHRR